MKLNIKLLLGFIYTICFSILMYLIFSKFSIKDLTDITFINNNREIINNFKSSNRILLLVGFFIFSVIWILLLGFASPIALVSGFIFGKWTGTIISVCSFTIGCTLLYCLVNLYFKDFVKKKLTGKIEKYINLFKKNEFFYFLLFRFTGGGMPFAIQNILPVIFNMKIKNYFFATFFGLIPGMFVLNALGSGIDKFISNNNTIVWYKVFLDSGIYLPIIGFFLILIITFFLKKIFFK